MHLFIFLICKMSKKKLPETSLEAYRKLDPLRLTKTYLQIQEALKVIKEGNFEMIANQIGIKPEKVWKRLSELENSGIIYKPGHKIPTSTGSNAYIYKLSSKKRMEKMQTERSLPGKTISDFSKSLYKQPTLF